MRQPASTEKEILLREINEVEESLAEASKVLGCTCIIDPTETLGDRVRHLAMMAILMQASIGQMRKFQNAKRVDENLDALESLPMSYQEMMERFNLNREN